MAKEMNSSEAVIGFVAWLTTREELTVISAAHDAAPLVELITKFRKANNMPEVSEDWPKNLVHPKEGKENGNQIYKEKQ